MKKLFFCFSFLVLLLVSWQKAWGSDATNDVADACVEVLAESTKSWDGALLPAYPQGQPKVTVLRISIPPKAKLPRHYHPIINAGVLTNGELTVIDSTNADNVKVLKSGDAIVEMVNTLHYGENRGDVPAVIVVFYAGTIDSVVSVKE